MNATDNLKTLCDAADTLQERIRRFPDEAELLAAARAAGMPDAEAFLAHIRSASVERRSGFILVPVLWDSGDLGSYREADSDDTSLFVIDQELARDMAVRAKFFHDADSQFTAYLARWAQELNRRGDELFQQYSYEDEGLTRGLARYVASLECSHAVVHINDSVEDLLGTPLLQGGGAREDADRAAVLSLVACLADISLNGTFMERLEAGAYDLPDTEEGQELGTDSGGFDDGASPERWSDQIEVEGQRFYPDIEAQELGSAVYIAELIAGAR